jgi:hypothetical protein
MVWMAAGFRTAASSSLSAVLPSAALSWLVMMATGLMFGALMESWLGHLELAHAGEYVAAFLVAMPVPFFLVIALVFAPVAMGLRALGSGGTSPWAFGVACVLTAPLAGLLLVAIGTAIWGPPSMVGGVATFVVPLFGIASGGMAFGMAFGRVASGNRHSNLEQLS